MRAGRQSFDWQNQVGGFTMLQNFDSNGKANQSSRNILIIDDDTDFIWLLTSLFNLHNFKVSSVTSGNEAIKSVEKNNPDVIILDIMLPDMDGWETYQRLRNKTDSPILILTGSEPGLNAKNALRIGGNDIMQKPFKSNELLEHVEALLQLAHSKHPGDAYQTTKREIRVKPTVSVIIPTLNEAKNLPLILPYLPMDLISEVILVDGRSTDGTVDVARKIMPSIKVVLEKKPGKGAAMIAGYQASSSEIIVVMDADGSNDPREIPRFLYALMQGADFVKGSRFASGGGTSDMPRIRRLGNGFFVHLVNFLFNSTFTDLCYGYHAFWAYSLCTLNLTGINGFEIDTALYLRAINDKLKITEVPSFEGYRFYGEGKLRTIPDGWRVLTTIFKEYWTSIIHPCHDLQMGFNGDAIHNHEVITNSYLEENLYNR
jgi:CheY-like chemotaxis protein